MGVYYLKHPIHGIHVATSDVEAIAFKANGWSDWAVGDPDPVLSPRQPVPEFKAKSAESEVEVLKAQMAAMAAQLAALAPKPEAPPAEPKAKAKAALPDLADVLKDSKPAG
jgi:hypothetical protein